MSLTLPAETGTVLRSRTIGGAEVLDNAIVGADGSLIDFATQTTVAAILAKLIAAPATEAKQDTGNTALANILAKLIAAPATEAKQDAAAILSGAVNETAPASDTASSGLNGRLQRIAQRLTSLIALLPASLGAKAGSASLSVVPASDAVTTVRTAGRNHETVAASQTDQMLGATGAAGDVLDGLLVVPATTSPGAVSIEYGSTNIAVFAGGADSVSNLVPFWIELGGIASVGGGWEITTGANVSVIAVGSFS